MSGSRTALVTGASGFIGHALVERLVNAGHRVVALTRNPANAFPAGVQVSVGDLATGAGVSEGLIHHVDLIFYCAGEVRQGSLMRQVHVGGTNRLLQCLRDRADRRGGPIHWVQLSSVGAYGPAARANCKRQVDEKSRENPVGEYEITKVESDGLVARAADLGLISYTILRPANVIGRHMPNASLRRVILMVQRGRFFYIGRPGAVAHYVHVDDVTSALMACATNLGSKGEIFNLSYDCLWEDLIERVAAVCRVKPPRLRVPEELMRAIVGALGTRLGNPVTAAAIDALVSRTSYPTTKIESALNFRFAMPMPEAVDDLIVPAPDA